MNDYVLKTTNLSRNFGGLIAVNNVSLSVKQKQIHAIIGPNGAGKSTMINLLTGQIKPSSGKIFFKDKDISGLPPNKISQLGVGRSFQRTNVFNSLTCFENCWLAAQSRLSHSLRFFRNAESYDSIRQNVMKVLALCHLIDHKDTQADKMSYGEQRLLEIGMVLATKPSCLVLDEPMAGMGTEESARLVQLLKTLADDYPLILVEHDMDAVFSIADVLTVMVNGEVLASGSVSDVRSNKAVQEAYLGDGTEKF